MRDGDLYPVLEGQFGSHAAKPKLYREGLVRGEILGKALRGRFGHVELPLPDVAMLAMVMAASETAVHAPLAAHRYAGLQAGPVVLEPIAQPEQPEALPEVLSGLRDDGHTLLQAFGRLFGACADQRTRYRLARSFMWTISRDLPSAELTVRDRRSGTAFSRRYDVGDGGDLSDLATMPGLDPQSGVFFPCVLTPPFFAAVGAALEESEQKRAAAEPRPDRRKQVSQAVARRPTNTHGRQNKSGAADGQPTSDLHESHHLTSEGRAGCPRSPSPRPPAG